MSGELVNLGLEGFDLKLVQVRAAREWLAATSEAEEIADMEERARLAHKVLKVVKEAADLAREVQTLQCEALRKLAQLGQERLLPKADRHIRSVARWLGGLTQEEFDRLMRECDPWHAATNLYHVHYYEPRQTRPVRSRSGEVARRRQGADLASAANVMLAHVAATGENITTADAALALADELGLPRSDVDDIRQEGLTEVVRQAFMHSGEEETVINVAGTPIRCPQFITYQSESPPRRWVRVPWNRATVGQLEFMATFRERQAEGLRQAAVELRALAQAAQERSRTIKSDRLSVLLGEMRKVMAKT